MSVNLAPNAGKDSSMKSFPSNNSIS